MIWNAIVVGVATLGVGFLLALVLRQLPTVRLQIAGLAALAVCLPLAAVLLSGWVMFHMGDDKKILAVSVGLRHRCHPRRAVARTLDRQLDRRGP